MNQLRPCSENEDRALKRLKRFCATGHDPESIVSKLVGPPNKPFYSREQAIRLGMLYGQWLASQKEPNAHTQEPN